MQAHIEMSLDKNQFSIILIREVKNMKKTTKIFAGVLGLAAIATATYFVVDKVTEDKKQQQSESEKPSRNYSDEERKTSDEIKKQLDDINEKINNDIKIPDDATEEEKKFIEEQKTYISVLKVIKDIQKNDCLHLQSYPDMDTEILSIDKIMKVDNNLLVLANTIVKDADVFFVKQVYYGLFAGNDSIVDSKTPEEFVEKLNSSQDVKMQEMHMIYEKEDDFCLDIYNNYAVNQPLVAQYINSGFQAKLIDSGLVDPYAAEHSNKCILAIELSKEETKKFILFEISFHNAQEKFGVDGVRSKVKAGDSDVKLYYKSISIYDDLGVDFRDTYDKLYDISSTEESGQKTQEAQAQAEIEEISTRDENGKVTGMDWDESQEKVEKKKAQNAAKLASQDAAMDYMPLYSDQELSL